MRYVICFVLILSIVSSCKKKERALNKFSDDVLITIADFQDRRAGNSLLKFLNSPEALYRREAALAYGSIQDSSFVPQLSKLLLNDPDSSVRGAAAYTLGQTPCLTSENILFKSSLQEKNQSVLREIVESYGKVATEWNLTLSADDSTISRALAWSYYRMAVRGLSNESLNARATALLNSPDINTRLAVVHYFARGAKNFARFQNDLIQTAKYDPSDNIRMAAALALQKILSDSSRITAEFLIKTDPDYRVRINAVRALRDFPFSQTKEVLVQALHDSSMNVGITAAETIKGVLTKNDWEEISALARKHEHWRIQANLFEAALAVSNDNELAEEITSVYNGSTNPYQKAALLTALQHSILSYQFVRDQLLINDEPVIKASAASSLVGMNYHKDFDPSLRPQFANLYLEAIGSGDAALLGIIIEALVDSTLNYKSVIKDFTFLKKARKKLSLPKDFESIASLESAIAYFEGRKNSPEIKSEFNHPIPWTLVKKIPRDQKAIIKTSKGIITIRLFIDEAPGSVANFISLVSNNFYDNKFFHRVVPNFVLQGGCPRGDGWGSEAYSIRSEFSFRRYNTGSIGMASAGKDTEGTQWFISHSPTPHLDGRYTIFAEVESGMDIVHKMEVGDRIHSIEIIGFGPL